MGKSRWTKGCGLFSCSQIWPSGSARAFAGRFTILAVGLTLVFGFRIPLAAAQATAPSAGAESSVQLMQPPGPGQSTPSITVTLQDALERARKNDPLFLSAVSDAKSAHEDRIQARASLLPTITATTQYLGTQGNGTTPNGRYVTNDGVHVYRAWGVLHQELSPSTFMATAYHRAAAAEALANARTEIARRGLTVAVTRTFYALIVAQRKYATAQQGLDQSKRFFDITQASERQGQSPRSDSIKAEIQYRLQQQAYDEAKLTMEDARLNLAVMLFPTLNENFSVVDNLDSAQALPAFPEVQAMAEKENPDLRVAVETVREADLDVSAAKTSFLPKLTIDTDYGIEANAFAMRSVAAGFAGDPGPRGGVLPNLGYFVTAALNIPVWDWGTLRSKLHQARYKQDQAKVQLSQTQRQLISNLYASYNEAAVARSAVEASRHTAELAAESLRLVNLRYTGGASTAFEVVDAQNTLVTARNAYDDAQARYRTALATLQTLTGNF
jgi:outer membrane protein TolC